MPFAFGNFAYALVTALIARGFAFHPKISHAGDCTCLFSPLSHLQKELIGWPWAAYRGLRSAGKRGFRAADLQSQDR
jgi:hypothetical protein